MMTSPAGLTRTRPGAVETRRPPTQFIPSNPGRCQAKLTRPASVAAVNGAGPGPGCEPARDSPPSLPGGYNTPAPGSPGAASHLPLGAALLLVCQLRGLLPLAVGGHAHERAEGRQQAGAAGHLDPGEHDLCCPPDAQYANTAANQ